MQETQVLSLDQEDSLGEEMATTPVCLPGKPHGRNSLAGKSQDDLATKQQQQQQEDRTVTGGQGTGHNF